VEPRTGRNQNAMQTSILLKNAASSPRLPGESFGD
jgi:hypothetical protein